MSPIKCVLFAEIKYRSTNLRLLYKIAEPQTSHELYISFDDLTAVMSRGKYAETREKVITDYRSKTKQACIFVDASATIVLPVISYGLLFKLMVEAKASDSFCDWITKAINNETETLSANRLNREIDELKAELDKWRNKKQDTVYILNFYPYDDGIYKIGLTDKIERRVADLNTGTPSEIIVEYKRDCGNKRIIEQMMHYILEKYRVNPNKEFFRIPKYLAITLLDNVVDYVDGLHKLMADNAGFDREKNEFTTLMDDFKALSADRIYKVVKPDKHAYQQPTQPDTPHRWKIW